MTDGPPWNLPLDLLDGAEASQWLGLEEALAFDEGEGTVTSVTWQHDSIPYLQLGRIDLRLGDQTVVSLIAHIESGLYLVGPPSLDYGHVSPISRWRELTELPLGKISVSRIGTEEPGVVAELQLRIGSDLLRLVAAEVHEQLDGTLRICHPDESILLQLNGARP